MGIFGALTTAIAGLRSQSFALEHVSDNIANSQTIGFKRTETVFQDLVTESRPGMQPGGSVIALSRATNTVAGDIQDSSIATHMSISGDGYFIVERRAGESDGSPVFLGVDLFTRRGDFELDKNGQLVNSAGYYLKGIPIDATTGNPSGGAPEVVTIDNGFLPAKATNVISYEANLPIYPKTANAVATIPGSELLDGAAFTNVPTTVVPATVVGTGAALSPDAAAAATGTAGIGPDAASNKAIGGVALNTATTLDAAGFLDGDFISISVAGGTAYTIELADDGIGSGTADVTLDTAGAGLQTVGDLVAGIAGATGIGSAVLSGGATGNLEITTGNVTDTLLITTTRGGVADDAPLTALGFTSSATPSNGGNAGQGVGDGATAGLRLFGANDDLEALVVAGGTLDIEVGGTSNAPITFGPGNISTRTQLSTALNALSGVNASFASGTNFLQISNESTTDHESSITLMASSATVLSELGLDAVDTTGGGTATVQTVEATNLMSQGFVDNQTLAITLGTGAPETITFGFDTGEVSTLAELSAALSALTDVTASVDSAGNVTVRSPNVDDSITIGGSVTLSNLGLAPGTTAPVTGAGTVLANELTPFIERTIAGGAITAYDVSGAPVDVQFRWGKISENTWNLFYLADSSATGSEVAWRNVGHDYTFESGALADVTNSIDITNLTVDGVTLGTIRLDHGNSEITQFADPNGVVSITDLDQNGYASGKLESVAVSESGRVVGSYSNGEQLELYEVSLASFNADGMLRKLDGGAFAITSESGPAIIGAQGSIVASTLEGSNADIADEFSKLIVTQQAYSAGTRIVTTADEMMQEALNMKR